VNYSIKKRQLNKQNMASATIFPEANINLGAGDNPDTYSMPAALMHRPEITGEMPYYVSKWQLSESEIEEVKKTGCVYLALMHTPVPASIHGMNPFNYQYNGSPEYQSAAAKKEN
jgi:hypothetical protein